jgi:hypothetical protein
VKTLRKLHHRFFSPDSDPLGKFLDLHCLLGLSRPSLSTWTVQPRFTGPATCQWPTRTRRSGHAGRTWAVHRVNCTGKHLSRLSY